MAELLRARREQQAVDRTPPRFIDSSEFDVDEWDETEVGDGRGDPDGPDATAIE
jgi:hypothetical protein